MSGLGEGRVPDEPALTLPEGLLAVWEGGRHRGARDLAARGACRESAVSDPWTLRTPPPLTQLPPVASPGCGRGERATPHFKINPTSLRIPLIPAPVYPQFCNWEGTPMTHVAWGVANEQRGSPRFQRGKVFDQAVKTHSAGTTGLSSRSWEPCRHPVSQRVGGQTSMGSRADEGEPQTWAAEHLALGDPGRPWRAEWTGHLSIMEVASGRA